MALAAYLVEDSAEIRQSLIEALAELAGIRTVGEAANEKAAVAWLTDPAHRWDLAIIDIVLEPGGSGLGVLRALKGRRPDQKAVVLTATASPEVRAQCMALGCDGVFDKAMDTEALLDWCAQLAQQA